MRVECQFFGPLRDEVGEKTVERDLPPDATVGDLVRDLTAEFDVVGERILADGDGGDEVPEDINVTVDGRNVRQRNGLATELTEGATVRFAPPVVGG